MRNLWFPNAYKVHISSPASRLTSYIIEHDLNSLMEAVHQIFPVEEIRQKAIENDKELVGLDVEFSGKINKMEL